MSPSRSIEYLTGFLMGFFSGLFLEGIFILIYTLLARWLAWMPLHPPWWVWIPLPLVCGLIMAKAIASLHLEDY